MANYDQMVMYNASSPYNGLCNRVGRRLGLGETPTAAQLRLIEELLNDAQKMIVRRYDLSCMERVDSSLILEKGKLSYQLPPQVRKIISARLIDDNCYVLDSCESGWTGTTNITKAYTSSYRRQGKTGLSLLGTATPVTGLIAYSASKNGSITAFADATEDRTKVTSASHGLSPGDSITIDGSTNYDGTYTVLNPDNDSDYFFIIADYTAETPSGVTWRTHVMDLSALNNAAIGMWIYATEAVTDLSITLTSAASGAETGTQGTDFITESLPSIAAFTWTYAKITGIDCTCLDDFKSIGIKKTAALSSGKYIYIDSINLYDQDHGGFSWPLSGVYSKQLDAVIANPEYGPNLRPTHLALSGHKDTELGNALEVYPVPNNSYPVWIRYYKWPEKLDYANNPSGYSELTDMDDVLTACATMLGFRAERAWKSANEWEGTYRRLLSEAGLDDQKKSGVQLTMQPFQANASMGMDLLEIATESAEGERGSSTGYFYLY